MPVIFKATCFYKYELDGHGWSESYYIQDDDRLSAGTKAKQIVTARLALAIDSVRAEYLRISVPGNPRDGTVYANDLGVGTYDAGLVKPPQVWDCLQFRVEDSVGHWAIRDLHAIDPAQFTEDNTPEFKDPWLPLWTSFKTVLIGNTMLPYKDAVPPFGRLYAGILRVEPIRRHTRKAGRPFDLQPGKQRIG